MPDLQLNVEYWPTNKPTDYANNARTHDDDQLNALVKAIQRFGFVNPIAVDEKGEIIAGHGRRMAAQRMGMEKIPVMVLKHLTPDEKRAYVLADNKLSDLGQWDHDLLAAEIQALVTGANIDFKDFGFSDSELSSFMPGYAESIIEQYNTPAPAAVQQQTPRSLASDDDYDREDGAAAYEPTGKDTSVGTRMDPAKKLEKYMGSSIRYMQLNWPEEDFAKLTSVMAALCKTLKIETNAQLVEKLVMDEANRQGQVLADEDYNSQADED